MAVQEQNRLRWGCAVVAIAVAVAPVSWGQAARAGEPTAAAWVETQKQVAGRIDALFGDKLDPTTAAVSPANDAVFLRRVSLDLTGTVPIPGEVRAFAGDADPQKRDRVIDELLLSQSFARNWARYWRDVMLYRATDQRARQGAAALERWLTEQFDANVGWDQIATELVTATGDIRENGSTFLMLAQMAQAPELAAETSRIFLGIQIQCAQCHDHPDDQWKREQFHELAAFFARVQIRRKQDDLGFFQYPQALLNQYDADKDGLLAVDEAPQPQREAVRGVLARFDRDNDEKLSLEELQRVRQQLARQRSFEVVGRDQNQRGGRRLAFFNNPRGLLDRFDADKDERIAAGEVPERQRQQLERLLQQFDADKDQKLSLEELQRIRQRFARAAQLDNPEDLLKRFDANEDGKLAVAEAPQPQRPLLRQLLRQFDADKDAMLSLEELQQAARRRRNTGGPEHYMPNLESPQDRGTLTHPIFFVSGETPGTSQTDRQRRQALAGYLTSPENVWFSRAFVNRTWATMMGWGFYEPIDDLGPARDPAYADVLDMLAGAFRDRGYDVKWLLGTIARTAAYQTQSVSRGAAGQNTAASACPTKLRADQLYDSLESALGGFGAARRPGRRGDQSPNARRRFAGGPRQQVQQLFGFDPSAPTDELSDSIPQALFLMNSPLLQRRIAARGNTTLGRLLRETENDQQALNDLYLVVLARQPSPGELQRCLQYLDETQDRREGFEDILWCLINSTEFRVKH